LQKTSGGNDNDITYRIRQTTDGGYVLAGGASSSGKVSIDSSNNNIYRVVKLDANENVTWQKTFGENYYESVSGVQQTMDSGYIVSGQTGVVGNNNYYIMKLDATGTMAWQKILVGNHNDIAHSIQLTKNGGYIIAGQTGTAGNYNYWIMKLDDEGDMIWRNTFGGSGDDIANSIQQTKDGGYIVAGSTSSNDGDVKGNHGGTDYWIVKLDENGNMTWQKTYGGSSEEVAKSIQKTKDGNFIVAGYTYSNDGDVNSNHGGADYWVVKLDTSGNIIWQKTFGGTGDDIANNIQLTNDGKYIVAGSTSSNDGDVTNNHGDSDYWVVKLGPKGNMAWQKTLGGSSEDVAGSIQQAGDSSYVIAGHTYSNDGDTKSNNSGQGYWIAKLTEPYAPVALTSDTARTTTSTTTSNAMEMTANKQAAPAISIAAVTATPNPFKNAFQLTVTSSVATKAIVRVTSNSGRTVFMQDVSLNTGTNIIPITSTTWAAGIYYVQVGTNAEIKSYKILKQ
jgi:hypothetical protein